MQPMIETESHNMVMAARENSQSCNSRRDMLRWTGLLLAGSLPLQQTQAVQRTKVRFAGMKKENRVDLGDRCAEIIEKAYKLGHEYEARYGGCCRCTVAALQKAIDFVPNGKGLFRAASCLDGGATPSDMQNCGSFTGAGMFIGWICGIEDFGNTGLSHNLLRQVFQHFKEEYGGVLCRDVRKGVDRDCPKAVGRAAKWTAGVLLRQFANYDPK